VLLLIIVVDIFGNIGVAVLIEPTEICKDLEVF
jgi:hypothetical protein